ATYEEGAHEEMELDNYNYFSRYSTALAIGSLQGDPVVVAETGSATQVFVLASGRLLDVDMQKAAVTPVTVSSMGIPFRFLVENDPLSGGRFTQVRHRYTDLVPAGDCLLTVERGPGEPSARITDSVSGRQWTLALPFTLSWVWAAAAVDGDVVICANEL